MTAANRPERLRRRPLGRYRYVRLRWRVLFSLIDAVGTVLFAAVRWLRATAAARWIGPTDPCDEPRSVRTILLVQLDHLGDGILTTGMLGPLRRRYPDVSIEVLASTANREVFEISDQVDCVHVSRINRFARDTRIGWIVSTIWWGLALRRRNVDLAIDVRGDFPVALMLWLSGARHRLGWDCGGGGFLLTDRAEFEPGRPEVESRLALLSRLGISAGDGPWQPVVRPTSAARHRVAALLDKPGAWLPPPTRIVIQMGAGTPAKCWPAEHWRRLVGRLTSQTGTQVILIGSEEERPLGQSILGPTPPAGVENWIGRLSVDELAALIEAADLFAGADSGPAHLAVAVGTPAVVLFSGTNDPGQWRPCGAKVRVLRRPVACSPCHRTQCPLPDHPCMRRLEPRRVAEAVEQLRDNRPRPWHDAPAWLQPLETPAATQGESQL